MVLKPIILADYREEKSGIDKLLMNEGIIVKFKQLRRLLKIE